MNKTLYWTATGLFCALFTGSILLTFGDLQGSYDEFQRLGFPLWTVYFLGTAKILGLTAILSNKSQTLKDFAFAGFLYDLLLALGGHIAQQEIKVLLAVFGIVIWVFAFVMDRKYYGDIKQTAKD
jgi:DoxX-like family